MKLSAPTQPIFLVSVILAALALLSTVIAIPFVSGHAFFFLLVGFVILALGNMLKGL